MKTLIVNALVISIGTTFGYLLTVVSFGTLLCVWGLIESLKG